MPSAAFDTRSASTTSPEMLLNCFAHKMPSIPISDLPASFKQMTNKSYKRAHAALFPPSHNPSTLK
jgi:hypothetical protein